MAGASKGPGAAEGAALFHPDLRSAPSPAGGGKRGVFHHAQVVVIERGRAAGLIDASPMAAADATGLETRHVSEHFDKRRGDGKGLGHRQRAWSKLTAVLHTQSHLIVAAVTGIGPSQDAPDFTPVMRQAASIMTFDTVLADAGYDAEHNHRLCREELGVSRSVIALNRRNTGRGWPKTQYRRALRQRFPRALYHQS